jgi:hypothetical protein
MVGISSLKNLRILALDLGTNLLGTEFGEIFSKNISDLQLLEELKLLFR